MKNFLAVCLMLLLPLTVAAEPCPCAPLTESQNSGRATAEPGGSTEPPAPRPQAAPVVEPRAWVPLLAMVEPCPYAPPPEPAKSGQQDAFEPTGSREAASASSQVAPQAQRPVWVAPALVKKKVVVYLRDGRVYKGKLLALSDDFLRLKIGKRTEKIALTEVAGVERQRSRVWLGIAVAGLAVGAVALVFVIGASRD